jgi:hypothetical protein
MSALPAHDVELKRLRARELDCGVCGVPSRSMVVVCEGYAVPRCADHLEMPAYQAEARLHSLLLLSTPSGREAAK